MNRLTNAGRTIGKKYVTVSGSFAPAGTSAPTSVKGKGFTVARNDVGRYTITFNDKFYDLVDFKASMQLSSAADIVPQFGDYDASARTLVLRLLAGATETEVAADANNRVHFSCTFRNSAVFG